MIQSAWLIALSLDVSGDCVDADRVRVLVQQELDLSAAKSETATDAELELQVTCNETSSEATFVLRRDGAQYDGVVGLSGLDQDLRERTMALAVAEALPLLRSNSAQERLETQDLERRQAEEGSPAPPATGASNDPPSRASIADADQRRESIESEAHAGGSVRIYPSGVVLFGGILGLRADRLGFTAGLLSSGGTIDSYDSAYTNLSVGVSYVVLRAGGKSVRGDFGARVSGGYTSSDDILRGYVGASGFVAADFRLTPTWRARLETEVGHAGFSPNEELRHAQGLFFAASLSLGVGGTI